MLHRVTSEYQKSEHFTGVTERSTIYGWGGHDQGFPLFACFCCSPLQLPLAYVVIQPEMLTGCGGHHYQHFWLRDWRGEHNRLKEMGEFTKHLSIDSA